LGHKIWFDSNVCASSPVPCQQHAITDYPIQRNICARDGWLSPRSHHPFLVLNC
jgi:hypothetical protein